MKIKALLYCCKEKNKEDRLVRDEHYGKTFWLYGAITENFESLNGKIVCECDIETEEIEDKVSYFDSWFNEGHHTKNMTNKELEKHSCLSYQDLCKYLGEGEPNEVIGYALHLSNIKVFDKPRELSDYSRRIDDLCYQVIGKAPQNMMYAYDFNLTPIQKYVLISIRPQWLCKILNGEKDIEVRRKVLKGMVE